MIAATCSWWSTNSTDSHPESGVRPIRPFPCGENGRSCWNSSGNSTWNGGGRFACIPAMRRRCRRHQRLAGLRSRPSSWTGLSLPEPMGCWSPLPRPFWALRAWLRSPHPLRGRDRRLALRRALRSSGALQGAGSLLPSWLAPLVWPPVARILRAWQAECPWRDVCWGRASTGQLWPVGPGREGVDHRTSVHSLSSRLWYGGTGFLMGQTT